MDNFRPVRVWKSKSASNKLQTTTTSSILLLLLVNLLLRWWNIFAKIAKYFCLNYKVWFKQPLPPVFFCFSLLICCSGDKIYLQRLRNILVWITNCIFPNQRLVQTSFKQPLPPVFFCFSVLICCCGDEMSLHKLQNIFGKIKMTRCTTR